MYELTETSTLVRRVADGAYVPTNAPLNAQCAEYLAWVSAGNVASFPAEYLVKYANAAQWQKAISGVVFVTIGGQPVPFQTTEASFNLIMGNILDMQMEDGPTSAHWQVGPVDFMDIAKDDMIAAGRAVKAYIQSTFDKLPAIFAGIADGSIATPADIDNAINQ